MASASQTMHDAVRTGSWWTQVAPVVLGLGAFTVYATWRAFEGAYFWAAPYLSPFYSPLLDVHHRYWPYSPALLILGGPLGFRATCYYYRKAYYRAFFLDPPAYVVAERKRNYCGETRFPFILQNVHRYFIYLAVVFLVFLWHDEIHAFVFADGFGIGVGTPVLLVNVTLLTLYFSSCHSLRHLLGRKIDCFSCATFGKARHSTWRGLSFCFLCQNVCHVLREHEKHAEFGGPRFFVRTAGLEMHPLDGVSRTASLNKELGLACAALPSAAPKSARKRSTSPITRSFPLRSAWWMTFMIRCCAW